MMLGIARGQIGLRIVEHIVLLIAVNLVEALQLIMIRDHADALLEFFRRGRLLRVGRRRQRAEQQGRRAE